MRVTKVLRVAEEFSVTVETDEGEEFEVLVGRKFEPELHFTEAIYGDHAVDVDESRQDLLGGRAQTVLVLVVALIIRAIVQRAALILIGHRLREELVLVRGHLGEADVEVLAGFEQRLLEVLQLDPCFIALKQAREDIR